MEAVLEPVVAAEAPPPPSAIEPVAHPFRFDGRTDEYFRIWIVNLALTIVTLGIYSAWAKVRTERYFYGNTSVAGTAFEYLAQPLQILKSRLVALAAFGAYALSSRFLPLVEPFLILAFLAVMPALIVASLRFRARYSSWRGLNFRFTGRIRDAYPLFLLWYLVVPFTLGLLIPWLVHRQKRYVVTHHRFGGAPFHFDAQASDFFGVYAIAFCIGMGVFALAMIPMMAATFLLGPNADPETAAMWMLPLVVVIYGGMFALGVYTRTKVTNLTYRGTWISGHRLHANLRARDMIKLYLTNALAIVFTVGLAIPWAMIRMARYRADHLTLVAHGDLDGFVAGARAEEKALGSEFADVFDLDVGA